MLNKTGKPARILALVSKKPMEVDEICEALSGACKYQVKFVVKRMHEKAGLLQNNFGYYTPTAEGLAALHFVPAVISRESRDALSVFAEFGTLTRAQFADLYGRKRAAAASMVSSLTDRKLIKRESTNRYRISEAGTRELEGHEAESEWQRPNTDAIVARAIATQPNSIFNLGKTYDQVGT